ncbi:MAG: hypothetical protein K0R77_374 [Chryseobacterium sp.]|jgi:hypothetical protein|nr:hypothetical protein [Clostridium sp.]MDF2551099.1 hypothetical protein [Chryseobacterium sp.]
MQTNQTMKIPYYKNDCNDITFLKYSEKISQCHKLLNKDVRTYCHLVNTYNTTFAKNNLLAYDTFNQYHRFVISPQLASYYKLVEIQL